MTIFRSVKSLLTITAGGAVFAGLVALVAVAVLVLFVIPGGLGILTIEFGRLKRWLRRLSRWLMKANPEPNLSLTKDEVTTIEPTKEGQIRIAAGSPEVHSSDRNHRGHCRYL
jgi:hypothetical protein